MIDGDVSKTEFATNDGARFGRVIVGRGAGGTTKVLPVSRYLRSCCRFQASVLRESCCECGGQLDTLRVSACTDFPTIAVSVKLNCTLRYMCR